MKTIKIFLLLISFFFLGEGLINAQDLDNFHSTNDYSTNPVINNINNNGYTTHWSDTYLKTFRYGSLYKMAVKDVYNSIMQNKVNIAEELGVSGLSLQEGFINELLSSKTEVLNQPTLNELESAINKTDVLVFTSPDSESGKKLLNNAGDIHQWKEGLTSHQFKAIDFTPTDVFYLENGNRKIFAVISSDSQALSKMQSLLKDTKKIVDSYDFRKGWMGVETLYKSVTCDFAHPVEVISKGMNEGNSWFVFSGYNEFRAKKEYKSWMDQIERSVFIGVGAYSGKRKFVFGCDNWDGLQEQDIEDQAYVDFVKEKHGYVFRPVYISNKEENEKIYDGYIVNEGNKEQLDNENLPFVNLTKSFSNGSTSSMVLFLSKGEKLNEESIIRAIKDRREIAVLPEGKIIGGAYFRNAMQLLMLDRVFLENYFGDRININTEVIGSEVKVTITNCSSTPVLGNLSLSSSASLKINDNKKEISIPANDKKELSFNVTIEKEATEKTNIIGVDFSWEKGNKSTIAMMDLPSAIHVHKLLYGQAPVVKYPVSILNFSKQSSFPVKVQVVKSSNPGKVVFEDVQQCEIAPDTYKDLSFDLKLSSDNYDVIVTALGCEAKTQLGVGNEKGHPSLKTVDLNNDGVNEYQLENDKVKVTLLATGARVIEYIVKSKDDNVFFKSWPEKPVDDRQPFRKRAFYPYGGFEDFLGQPSLETHKVYDAEIVKSEGNSVAVKMTSDYFGNQLEKTFTLFGDSPLLEIKYKINFVNKETDMIGPQPILELGEAHDSLDVFMIPDVEGLLKYKMRQDKYYGHIFTLTEGWQAGIDTKENVSFVGAFPVDQPDFLHMWMNHPNNHGARHYYVEFQPWIRITKKNTMYFSYFMWADEGSWENGVKELRKRNLITKSKLNKKK